MNTKQIIEKVVGSLDDKKRWRAHKARVRRMPTPHREAAEALVRYLTYRGAIVKGEVLMNMLEDLDDLFEQAATDRTPVRRIVGDDPVEFAETFLANYSDAEWIQTERDRLTAAIDAAAGGQSA